MLIRSICLYALIVITYLPGCGQSQTKDLQGYIADVKSRKHKMDDANFEMVLYPTYTYNRENKRDPFTHIPNKEETKNLLSCTPPNHITGALENYPLDSLAFVGNVKQRESSRWALIRTQDGSIFKLKTNDYIGQNNGRITKISENTIELTELVHRGDGCVTKQTVLTLNQ